MTFNQSVSSVFSKFVTFSGRASRSEFWYFALFELFVYVILALVRLAVRRSEWRNSGIRKYPQFYFRSDYDSARAGGQRATYA